MAVHKFTTPAGEEMVILPEAEYVDLTEEREDRAAIRDLQAKLSRGEEEFLPAAMVKRMMAGENLVQIWREHRGLTISALAEKAGISPSYLSQIEGGSREGTLSTYKKIAAALDISLHDLV